MGLSLGRALRGIVEQAVGLIVDDGFIAVGAVVALVVTGLLASAPIDLVPQNALGVVLFGIVTVVLLGSLVRAGRAARSSAEPPPSGVEPRGAQPST